MPNRSKHCERQCLQTGIYSSREWSVLTQSELAQLQENTACCHYNPGEIIYHEGAISAGTYYIRAGLVGIRKNDLNGNTTLINLAYGGDTIGYQSLLSHQPHQNSAEVLKAASICFVPARVVLAIVEQNPQMGYRFLELATRSLNDSETRYHEAVTLSVKERFYHLLYQLIKECKLHGGEYCCDKRLDKSLELQLPISRTELAAMMGIRRETLSRVISEMEKNGILHFTGRALHITDYELFVSALEA